MFCRFCGKEIDDNAVFCIHCGKSIAPSVEEAVAKVVVKEKEPIITKPQLIHASISLLLAVIYAGISFVLIKMLYMSDTILVKSAFDENMNGYITLKEFLDILLKGNRIFNPTILSTTIGIGIYLLVYSVPVFAGFAFISALVGKKSVALHTVFCFMTILSSGAVVAFVPISMMFITDIKYAIALKASILYEDIKALSYTKPIVLVGVAVALVIVASVVLGILNKRREKTC